MFNWIPLLCLSLTMAGYSFGIGPILMVMLGEVIPVQIKNSTNGILNSLCSLASMSAVASFLVLKTNIRLAETFWLFVTCCFLLMVVFHIFLPETKGKALAMIEKKLTMSDLWKVADAKDMIWEHSMFLAVVLYIILMCFKYCCNLIVAVNFYI